MAEGRFQLLGASVDPLTLEQVVQAVDAMVAEGRQGQHGCVNAAKIVRLQRDEALRSAIATCDLVTADGQSVVWASRLLGRSLPERVAGIDLMHALFARAAECGYRVYLLGARHEVVTEAAAEACRLYPGLVVAGHRHGYFTADEEAGVVASIAEARPDLLFLALETPAKELFLARHRDALRIPFAMGVGGSLDVLAGRRKRAPRWAQQTGLEWAFRLAQEPRRLAGRYAAGNVRFIALVLRELMRTRLFGRRETVEGGG